MAQILTALSETGTVRVLVCNSTDMVQQAHEYHNTSPVVSAALGRLLTAASMMGSLLKNNGEMLSLQVKGDGPIGSITATADNLGNVKGYAANPHIDLPLKENGKLDVSGAVGEGTLSVVRDNITTGVPYIGKIPLVSGEIAEDITSYFANSEQTPTVCALGVLVDTDLSILSAGGVLIQLMPGVEEETISMLEKNITKFSSVSSLFKEKTLEEIAAMALEGIGESMHFIRNAAYKCDCSKEKCEQMLLALNNESLKKIVHEDGKADIVCGFCNRSYHFDKNELLDILAKK